MKAFLLLGGVLYTAAIGWWLMGRLGQFLDKGGISPYWAESEELADEEEEMPSESGTPPDRIVAANAIAIYNR